MAYSGMHWLAWPSLGQLTRSFHSNYAMQKGPCSAKCAITPAPCREQILSESLWSWSVNQVSMQLRVSGSPPAGHPCMSVT